MSPAPDNRSRNVAKPLEIQNFPSTRSLFLSLIAKHDWSGVGELVEQLDRRPPRMSNEDRAILVAAAACQLAPIPLCAALAELPASSSGRAIDTAPIVKVGETLSKTSSFRRMNEILIRMTAAEEQLTEDELLRPFLIGVASGLSATSNNLIHTLITIGETPLVLQLLQLYRQNFAPFEIIDEISSSQRPLRLAGRSSDRYSDSLLHHAAESGRTELFEAIITNGKIPVNQPGRNRETALFRAWDSGNAAAIVRLEKLGADNQALDEAGRTPIVVACQKRGLAATVELASEIIRMGTPTPEEGASLAFELSEKARADLINSISEQLKKLPRFASEAILRCATTTGIPNLRLIPLLTELYELLPTATKRDIATNNQSLLYAILSFANQSEFAQLQAFKELTSSPGPLPLWRLAMSEAAERGDLAVVTRLFLSGVPLWSTTPGQAGPLQSLLYAGQLEFITDLMRKHGATAGALIPPPSHEQEERSAAVALQSLISFDGNELGISTSELLVVAGTTYTGLGSDDEESESTVGSVAHFLDHPDFLRRLRIVTPFVAAMNSAGERDDIASAVRALPALFYTDRNFAGLQSVTRSDRRTNAFEAERLLLLNSPSGSGDTQQALQTSLAIVDRLTEQYNYVGAGITNIRGNRLNLWAHVGVLNFSFRSWRFDAMKVLVNEKGQPESLFERFGLRAVVSRRTDSPDPESRHPGFGPAYRLRPGTVPDFTQPIRVGRGRVDLTFDSRSWIEFRRAYLLVSHPDFGTLLIRNSSPEYGRNSLRAPALYSRKGIGNGFTSDNLHDLSPAYITKEFTPLLHPSINGAVHRGAKPDALPHCVELLKQLRAVQERYRAWKFDTQEFTAWRGNPSDDSKELIGGHFSPGFPSVVEALEQWWTREDLARSTGNGARSPVPELAFVSTELPPWAEIPFTDSNGNLKHRLKVTPAVLDTLRALIDGVAADEDLAATGIRSFIQDAGLRGEGELVLLGPSAP